MDEEDKQNDKNIHDEQQKGDIGWAGIQWEAPANNWGQVARGFHLSTLPRGFSLRDWWHQILREHGRYKCYAFVLCLPADKEAIRYLTDYGKELDLVSNERCLVIALSKTEFRRSGFDEKIWSLGVNEQISEGYGIAVARILRISLTDFPCIVLFEDVRSPKKVIFSFKDKTAEEIAGNMRAIFSRVDQAIKDKKSPVTYLERYQGREGLHKASQSMIDKLFSFAGRTFEAAVEAWIKAAIK